MHRGLYFLFFAIAFGLIDGHIFVTSLTAILIFICGYHQVNKLEIENRPLAQKLFAWVAVIYTVTSYIFSIAYSSGPHNYCVDPFSYIALSNLTSPDIDYSWYVQRALFDLEDLNFLHEIGLRVFIVFSNNILDGTSPFTLAYAHTAFGIMSIGILYRVLLIYFPRECAYKYSILFAVCSPFLWYSSVVIRDTIVAFFYLKCFDIILRDYKTRNLVWLLIYMFITFGIRLYSGLFVASFIVFYIFKVIKNSKALMFLLPLFGMLLIGLIYNYLLGSTVYNQSAEELQNYVEYDTERAIGFTSKLARLPSGLKEMALSLYSQMNPFPCYDGFKLVHNAPLAFMAIMQTIYAFWWYTIFYGLLYALVLKKGYRYLSLDFYLLLGIAAVYIVLNSVQIDVRRIMAIYPIILIIYLYVYRHLGESMRLQSKNVLTTVYCCLLLIYILFIQR